MSVRFVTSDNKYVQYRYTGTNTATADFTNIANWELDVTNKTLSEDFLGLLSEVKDFTINNYALTEQGKFGTSTSYKHAVIPVSEGEVYYLVGASNLCRAAFATSDSATSGGDIPLVSGTLVMPMPAVGQYYKYIIPSDCTHLLFNAKGNYGTRCFKHYCNVKDAVLEISEDTPTIGSNKFVNSDGIANSLNTKTDAIIKIRSYLFNHVNVELTNWRAAYLRTSDLSIGDTVTESNFNNNSSQYRSIIVDLQIYKDIKITKYHYHTGTGNPATANLIQLDKDFKVTSISGSAADVSSIITPSDNVRYVIVNANLNTSAGSSAYFKIVEISKDLPTILNEKADKEQLTTEVNISNSFVFTDNRAIQSNGVLNTNSSVNSATIPYVDLKGASHIYITMNKYVTAPSRTVGLAFYSEQNEESFISFIEPNIDSSLSEVILEERSIEVPENAKYIRTTVLIRLKDDFYCKILVPVKEGFTILKDEVDEHDERLDEHDERLDALESNEKFPIGLHTTPENNGMLNVVKRCRQLTDVKWTPAVDLPRYMYASTTPPFDGEYDDSDAIHYLGVFKAGKEYKGIPYGRTGSLQNYGYQNAFVGLNVSIDTFITAVQNEESVISKESVGSVQDHTSTVYACVCSAFTCYALGLSTFYPTASIPNIPNLNLITALKVDNNYINPNIFKLGDVLNLQSFHTAIITDIVKNSNGDVVFIEESEATTVGEANPDIVGGQDGGICRRVGFSVEDFFARFGEYFLYRYENIASVTYTPSKYVNVGDELDMFRLEHLPCMPYMGEGFVYKSGNIASTKIVITTDRYNYLRVLKDGIEISGSPFNVDANLGYVETGFSDTGDYEAYLCNMSGGSNTKVSAKCHWSVV